MINLETYRVTIARLEDDGYKLCEVKTEDTLGHQHYYLYMWKRAADGKLDWVEIGPIFDRDILRFIVVATPLGKDNRRIGPPVVSPGSPNPLTRPPEEQRLKLDLEYYRTRGYVIQPRKRGGIYHMVAQRRGDKEGDVIDVAPYEMVAPICEELDIDISDIRRLKAEGYNFGRASSGAVTARMMKNGIRDVVYIGVYDGPVVDLCKKNDIKIKNE